jgi:hypothetical protein
MATLTKKLMSGWFGAVVAVVMVGCGGAGGQADVRTVGPQGATFSVAGSALQIEIPAGAVQRETELRFREVEPRQGEVRAFQVEPELDSSAAIRVMVKIDDATGQGKHHLVEIENEVEHGVEAELEDAAEHRLSGEVHHLGHIGVKRADDGAAHDANDDDGAAQAQPADDKNAPAPTPADDKGTI